MVHRSTWGGRIERIHLHKLPPRIQMIADAPAQCSIRAILSTIRHDRSAILTSNNMNRRRTPRVHQLAHLLVGNRLALPPAPANLAQLCILHRIADWHLLVDGSIVRAIRSILPNTTTAQYDARRLHRALSARRIMMRYQTNKQKNNNNNNNKHK